MSILVLKMKQLIVNRDKRLNNYNTNTDYVCGAVRWRNIKEALISCTLPDVIHFEGILKCHGLTVK